MNSLTLKQRTFAKEYALEGNRRQAAIRAGYRVKSASERGGKLLQDPRIQSLIEKERAAQIEPDDTSLLGHVRALAAIRDEARAAGKFQAAAQAERARGFALGFQQAGQPERPEPEPPPAKEDETDWHLIITGKSRPEASNGEPKGADGPDGAD